ncbi:MAG: hypothetical protein IT445_18090 [Phycisphaeraceae bacterium]|nr:hypothetical protein [Phycisphaeraceae bacterium]
MKSITHLLVALFAAWFMCVPNASADRAAELSRGSGSFQFVDQQGNRDKPLTVWTYVPADAKRDSPIVFVMHGVRRNGRDYRDNWIEHARKHNFLLLVPEFSEDDYPSEAYQQGNILSEQGSPNPPAQWTFTAIEHLFDYFIQISSSTSEGYYLYGHSAGGQFVHRFALFMPQSRCLKAVTANSGWYTLPTDAEEYPYGLGKTPATSDSLKQALKRNVVVMLGEKDTNAKDPNLRHTPQADAQGATRLERGRYFFQQVRNAAERLHADFGWKLVIVPDAAHSDKQMSQAAVDELFPPQH